MVPNLVGLGVDEAKATVAAKGFKFNYQIDNQPNSAQANFVTRQDPAARAECPAGHRHQRLRLGRKFDQWWLIGDS